jgi:hypothetical protein
LIKSVAANAIEVNAVMRKKAKMPADLLKALNYTSAEEAALDMLFLSARPKYAEFHQEVKRFEVKYGMTLAAFQGVAEARVNEEDFEQEEDLMAWKFAQEAADYWRHKIEELEHAAGFSEAVSGSDSRGGEGSEDLPPSPPQRARRPGRIFTCAYA